MARVLVLKECVVGHTRRLVGEEITVDAATARLLADSDPEGFTWVDRPVRQFVDVTPAPPVGEDKARRPARGRKGVNDESTG